MTSGQVRDQECVDISEKTQLNAN